MLLLGDMRLDCHVSALTVDHHMLTILQEFDRPNSAYMLIYERAAAPPCNISAAQASPGGDLLQGLSVTSPPSKGRPSSLPYDMAPVLFYVRG